MEKGELRTLYYQTERFTVVNFTPCTSCIWDGLLVSAIGKSVWGSDGTSSLDFLWFTWSRCFSFGLSIPTISSKDKAILSAKIASGKGKALHCCYAAALWISIFSISGKHIRTSRDGICRLCFAFYPDPRIFFFGQAQSRPHGALDEVEKRRPGTSY